jgi:hypothetical protein
MPQTVRGVIARSKGAPVEFNHAGEVPRSVVVL